MGGNNFLIIGIIAGVVVLFLLLVIIGIIVFVMMKKKKAKQQQLSGSNTATPAFTENQPMPSAQYEVSPSTPPAWSEPIPQSAPAWSEPTPQSAPAWSQPVNTPTPATQAWTPEPAPPPPIQPTPSYAGQYTVEEESYNPAPPFSEPEPISQFTAPPPPPPPSNYSMPEPPQPSTGPIPPGMMTMPPAPPTYPTSPNVRLDTSQHTINEVSAPQPTPPAPPVESQPVPTPILEMPIDERGITMDLSQYKKLIEEQLKPKSPGSIFFTSGALEGQSFEIPPEGFYVGRDSHSAQVVIPDPRVSKTHVWIGVKDGRVLVVDQESRNGTFINDTNTARASQREVHDGDIIILGEANVARFEFRAVK